MSGLEPESRESEMGRTRGLYLRRLLPQGPKTWTSSPLKWVVSVLSTRGEPSADTCIVEKGQRGVDNYVVPKEHLTRELAIHRGRGHLYSGNVWFPPSDYTQHHPE